MNNCFFKEEKGKRTAVLIFHRDQLLYDIRNNAYIEGSVVNTTAPNINNQNRDNATALAHTAHMIQDIGNDGNIDRVSRVLNLAHAHIKESLYPYTKHIIHDDQITNLLRKPNSYSVVLQVPHNFSQTSLILLQNFIHEYYVCRVIADWLTFTYPQKTQPWIDRAEQAEKEIRRCLINRTNPIRRKPSIF